MFVKYSDGSVQTEKQQQQLGQETKQFGDAAEPPLCASSKKEGLAKIPSFIEFEI